MKISFSIVVLAVQLCALCTVFVSVNSQLSLPSNITNQGILSPSPLWIPRSAAAMSSGGGAPASNALDGDPATIFHTNAGAYEFYRVDLLVSRCVGVVMHNRYDAHKERLNGAKLFISATLYDNVAPDYETSTFFFNNNAISTSTTQCGAVLDGVTQVQYRTCCPTYGRYLYLHLANNNLHLSEFIVYEYSVSAAAAPTILAPIHIPTSALSNNFIVNDPSQNLSAVTEGRWDSYMISHATSTSVRNKFVCVDMGVARSALVSIVSINQCANIKYTVIYITDNVYTSTTIGQISLLVAARCGPMLHPATDTNCPLAYVQYRSCWPMTGRYIYVVNHTPTDNYFQFHELVINEMAIVSGLPTLSTNNLHVPWSSVNLKSEHGYGIHSSLDFDNSTFFHTGSSGNEWFRADMGASRSVQVTIYNRLDGPERLNASQVYISELRWDQGSINDGNYPSSCEILAVLQQPKCGAYLDASRVQTRSCWPYYGRYLYIVQPRNEHLHFAEIVFHEFTSSYYSHHTVRSFGPALYIPSTHLIGSTGQSTPQFNWSSVVDREYNTAFRTPTQTNNWLRFDLGSAKTVQVTLFDQSTDPRIAGTWIFLTDQLYTGSITSSIIDTDRQRACGAIVGQIASGWIVRSCWPQRGRYVYLFKAASTDYMVYEVIIHEMALVAPSPTLTNIRLRPHLSSVIQTDAHGEPWYIFDERNDTTGWAGNANGDAFFRIDMGASRSVQVTIRNRDSPLPLDGARVVISEMNMEKCGPTNAAEADLELFDNNWGYIRGMPSCGLPLLGIATDQVRDCWPLFGRYVYVVSRNAQGGHLGLAEIILFEWLHPSIYGGGSVHPQTRVYLPNSAVASASSENWATNATNAVSENPQWYYCAPSNTVNWFRADMGSEKSVQVTLSMGSDRLLKNEVFISNLYMDKDNIATLDNTDRYKYKKCGPHLNVAHGSCAHIQVRSCWPFTGRYLYVFRAGTGFYQMFYHIVIHEMAVVTATPTLSPNRLSLPRSSAHLSSNCGTGTMFGALDGDNSTFSCAGGSNAFFRVDMLVSRTVQVTIINRFEYQSKLVGTVLTISEVRFDWGSIWIDAGNAGNHDFKTITHQHRCGEPLDATQVQTRSCWPFYGRYVHLIQPTNGEQVHIAEMILQEWLSSAAGTVLLASVPMHIPPSAVIGNAVSEAPARNWTGAVDGDISTEYCGGPSTTNWFRVDLISERSVQVTLITNSGRCQGYNVYISNSKLEGGTTTGAGGTVTELSSQLGSRYATQCGAVMVNSAIGYYHVRSCWPYTGRYIYVWPTDNVNRYLSFTEVVIHEWKVGSPMTSTSPNPLTVHPSVVAVSHSTGTSVAALLVDRNNITVWEPISVADAWLRIDMGVSLSVQVTVRTIGSLSAKLLNARVYISDVLLDSGSSENSPSNAILNGKAYGNGGNNFAYIRDSSKYCGGHLDGTTQVQIRSCYPHFGRYIYVYQSNTIDFRVAEVYLNEISPSTSPLLSTITHTLPVPTLSLASLSSRPDTLSAAQNLSAAIDENVATFFAVNTSTYNWFRVDLGTFPRSVTVTLSNIVGETRLTGASVYIGDIFLDARNMTNINKDNILPFVSQCGPALTTPSAPGPTTDQLRSCFPARGRYLYVVQPANSEFRFSEIKLSSVCAGCCPGYMFVDYTTKCVDINECDPASPGFATNGGCDVLTSCTNTNGSRTCSACPLGYIGTGETKCVLPRDENNLFIPRSAVAASSGNTPYHCVDNDPTTFTQTGNTNALEWIRIDMGASRIVEVTIQNRYDAQFPLLDGASVRLSPILHDVNNVYSIDYNSGIGGATYPASFNTTAISALPRCGNNLEGILRPQVRDCWPSSGRYLYVIQPGNKYLYVSEISAIEYTHSFAQTPIAIPLVIPPSALDSSIEWYSSYHPRWYGFDGLLNTYFTTDAASLTANPPIPNNWLRVDLGSAKSVQISLIRSDMGYRCSLTSVYIGNSMFGSTNITSIQLASSGAVKCGPTIGSHYQLLEQTRSCWPSTGRYLHLLSLKADHFEFQEALINELVLPIAVEPYVFATLSATALKLPVSSAESSCLWQHHYGAWYSVDSDDRNGQMFTRSCHVTNQNYGALSQWFRYDLQASRSVQVTVVFLEVAAEPAFWHNGTTVHISQVLFDQGSSVESNTAGLNGGPSVGLNGFSINHILQLPRCGVPFDLTQVQVRSCWPHYGRYIYLVRTWMNGVDAHLSLYEVSFREWQSPAVYNNLVVGPGPALYIPVSALGGTNYTAHGNMAVLPAQSVDFQVRNEFYEYEPNGHPWWRANLGSRYSTKSVQVTIIENWDSQVASAWVFVSVNFFDETNITTVSDAGRKLLSHYRCGPILNGGKGLPQTRSCWPYTGQFLYLYQYYNKQHQGGIYEILVSEIMLRPTPTLSANRLHVSGGLSAFSVNGNIDAHGYHRAMDGDTTSFYHSDGSNIAQWFRVDLGASRSVLVTIFNRMENSPTLSGVSIRVSEVDVVVGHPTRGIFDGGLPDGIPGLEYRVNIDRLPVCGEFLDASVIQVRSCWPNYGRYIYVFKPSKNENFHFSEISFQEYLNSEVYNGSFVYASAPHTIPLASAIESSSVHDPNNYNVSQTVDGDFPTFIYMHRNPKDTHWFRVDMGSSKSVQVTLTDHGGNIMGLFLYISNLLFGNDQYSLVSQIADRPQWALVCGSMISGHNFGVLIRSCWPFTGRYLYLYQRYSVHNVLFREISYQELWITPTPTLANFTLPISPSAVATKSNSDKNSRQPAHGVDNDHTTFFQTKNDGGSKWYRVDMGASRSVEVTITNRHDGVDWPNLNGSRVLIANVLWDYRYSSLNGADANSVPQEASSQLSMSPQCGAYLDGDSLVQVRSCWPNYGRFIYVFQRKENTFLHFAEISIKEWLNPVVNGGYIVAATSTLPLPAESVFAFCNYESWSRNGTDASDNDPETLLSCHSASHIYFRGDLGSPKSVQVTVFWNIQNFYDAEIRIGNHSNTPSLSVEQISRGSLATRSYRCGASLDSTSWQFFVRSCWPYTGRYIYVYQSNNAGLRIFDILVEELVLLDANPTLVSSPLTLSPSEVSMSSADSVNGVAGKAVDLDTSTSFSTKAASDQWIRVDMGASRSVQVTVVYLLGDHKMKLNNSQVYISQFLLDWKLTTPSTDGNGHISAMKNLPKCGAPLNGYLAAGVHNVRSCWPSFGRFIYVLQPASGVFQIHEIILNEFVSRKTAYQLLPHGLFLPFSTVVSLNSSNVGFLTNNLASSSTTSTPLYGNISMAFDGNLNTVFSSTQGSNKWFRVDMIESRSVEVTLTPPANDVHFGNARVYVSNMYLDSTNATLRNGGVFVFTYFMRQCGFELAPPSSASLLTTQVRSCWPNRGRYLYVIQERDSQFQVSEVSISVQCQGCCAGYQYNSTQNKCVDVNECDSNTIDNPDYVLNGACDILTTCVNTIASRYCTPCPWGYIGTGETQCLLPKSVIPLHVHASAITSSSFLNNDPGSYRAQRVVDYDNGTHVGTNQVANQWVRFDLGANRSVEVTIYNYFNVDRLSGSQLYLSATLRDSGNVISASTAKPVTAELSAIMQEGKCGANLVNGLTNQVQVRSCFPNFGRYLYLLNPGTSGLVFTEIVFFEYGGHIAPTITGLVQPIAVASSDNVEYRNGGSARNPSNAVDNDFESLFCTMTASASDRNWFRADLGSAKSVQVSIAEGGGRIDFCSVYISNDLYDTSSIGSLSEVRKCGPTLTAQQTTYFIYQVRSCWPLSGRYVYVVQPIVGINNYFMFSEITIQEMLVLPTNSDLNTSLVAVPLLVSSSSVTSRNQGHSSWAVVDGDLSTFIQCDSVVNNWVRIDLGVSRSVEVTAHAVYEWSGEYRDRINGSMLFLSEMAWDRGCSWSTDCQTPAMLTLDIESLKQQPRCGFPLFYDRTTAVQVRSCWPNFGRFLYFVQPQNKHFHMSEIFLREWLNPQYRNGVTFQVFGPALDIPPESAGSSASESSSVARALDRIFIETQWAHQSVGNSWFRLDMGSAKTVQVTIATDVQSERLVGSLIYITNNFFDGSNVSSINSPLSSSNVATNAFFDLRRAFKCGPMLTRGEYAYHVRSCWPHTGRYVVFHSTGNCGVFFFEILLHELVLNSVNPSLSPSRLPLRPSAISFKSNTDHEYIRRVIDQNFAHDSPMYNSQIVTAGDIQWMRVDLFASRSVQITLYNADYGGWTHNMNGSYFVISEILLDTFTALGTNYGVQGLTVKDRRCHTNLLSRCGDFLTSSLAPQVRSCWPHYGRYLYLVNPTVGKYISFYEVFISEWLHPSVNNNSYVFSSAPIYVPISALGSTSTISEPVSNLVDGNWESVFATTQTHHNYLRVDLVSAKSVQVTVAVSDCNNQQQNAAKVMLSQSYIASNITSFYNRAEVMHQCGPALAYGFYNQIRSCWPRSGRYVYIYQYWNVPLSISELLIHEIIVLPNPTLSLTPLSVYPSWVASSGTGDVDPALAVDSDSTSFSQSHQITDANNSPGWLRVDMGASRSVQITIRNQKTNDAPRLNSTYVVISENIADYANAIYVPHAPTLSWRYIDLMRESPRCGAYLDGVTELQERSCWPHYGRYLYIINPQLNSYLQISEIYIFEWINPNVNNGSYIYAVSGSLAISPLLIDGTINSIQAKTQGVDGLIDTPLKFIKEHHNWLRFDLGSAKTVQVTVASSTHVDDTAGAFIYASSFYLERGNFTTFINNNWIMSNIASRCGAMLSSTKYAHLQVRSCWPNARRYVYWYTYWHIASTFSEIYFQEMGIVPATSISTVALPIHASSLSTSYNADLANNPPRAAIDGYVNTYASTSGPQSYGQKQWFRVDMGASRSVQVTIQTVSTPPDLLGKVNNSIVFISELLLDYGSSTASQTAASYPRSNSYIAMRSVPRCGAPLDFLAVNVRSCWPHFGRYIYIFQAVSSQTINIAEITLRDIFPDVSYLHPVGAGVYLTSSQVASSTNVLTSLTAASAAVDYTNTTFFATSNSGWFRVDMNATQSVQITLTNSFNDMKLDGAFVYMSDAYLDAFNATDAAKLQLLRQCGPSLTKVPTTDEKQIRSCFPWTGRYIYVIHNVAFQFSEIVLNEVCNGCCAGYVYNHTSGACQDINECALSTPVNGGCNALATCTNTVGSRICICPAGTAGNGISECVDINECLTSNGGCHALAVCTNTVGSRTCSACAPGYSGDGVTCTDINECLTSNGGCHVLANCTNTEGNRTCSGCPAGYSGTGYTSCDNINECLLSVPENGGCDLLTSCLDTTGSRTCSACPTGYSGTGETNCSISLTTADKSLFIPSSAVATSSNSDLGNRPPHAAVDGDLNTFFSTSASSTGQWFRVDMGASRSVVVTINNRNVDQAKLAGARLYISPVLLDTGSSQNSPSDVIANIVNITAANRCGAYLPGDLVVVRSCFPHYGRYLYVHQPNNVNLHFSEIVVTEVLESFIKTPDVYPPIFLSASTTLTVASSTLASSSPIASVAIDGDVSTAFLCTSIADNWLMADITSPKSVQVTITNPLQDSSLAGASVYISSNLISSPKNSDMVGVAAHVKCGPSLTVQLTHQQVRSCWPALGRYVYVVQPNIAALKISEIMLNALIIKPASNVIGMIGETSPFIPPSSVTTSSNSDFMGGPPFHAVDGDSTSYFSTNGQANQWFRVDLGSSYSPVISIYNRQDADQSKLAGAQIFLSELLLDSGSSQNSPSNPALYGGNTVTFIRQSPRCGEPLLGAIFQTCSCWPFYGRYVYILQPSAVHLHFSELLIDQAWSLNYNKPSVLFPQYISSKHLGSSAVQSTLTGVHAAVDAIHTTSFVCNSIVDNWFRADLGAKRTVQVTLTQQSLVPGALQGASVFIGDPYLDSSNITSTHKHSLNRCGPDLAAQLLQQQVRSCWPYAGKYVYVIQPNNVAFQFAEITFNEMMYINTDCSNFAFR